MQMKQRLAVYAYVNMEIDKRGASVPVVVEATLQASRKTPDSLYSLLRRKGYKWSVKNQRWFR